MKMLTVKYRTEEKPVKLMGKLLVDQILENRIGHSSTMFGQEQYDGQTVRVIQWTMEYDPLQEMIDVFNGSHDGFDVLSVEIGTVR